MSRSSAPIEPPPMFSRQSGRSLGSARGCGENLQYDAMGRLVGEDYSPCDSTNQPAYTPGHYTTGDGLEAFYVYDAPEAPAPTTCG